MSDDTQILAGWKEIAAFARVSERTIRNHRYALLTENIIWMGTGGKYRADKAELVEFLKKYGI